MIQPLKLYHVSEEPGIEVFKPRPALEVYDKITGSAVFAISEKMLHNYLLPRDCPRVTYYSNADSLQADIDKYIGNTDKKFIINVEEHWIDRINNAKMYLYEMPYESFELLDEVAGYYVSYKTIKPKCVFKVVELTAELKKRNAELRVLPSIKELAGSISGSTLQFSIIRLRNAK